MKLSIKAVQRLKWLHEATWFFYFPHAKPLIRYGLVEYDEATGTYWCTPDGINYLTEKGLIMKHIVILAEFKGEDGSLGYKVGTVYRLKLFANSNRIERFEGQLGRCEYASIYAFFQNWIIR